LFVIETAVKAVFKTIKNVSMINNRKMNVVKRIAFVASDNNRKSLIEWSYYNQEILKNHELIATGVMADKLLLAQVTWHIKSVGAVIEVVSTSLFAPSIAV